MLPDEVGEAVERTDAALELAGPQHTVFIGNKAAWRTIRAHLLAREVEVADLRAKTACALGVGRGDGNLFVHGDYDSIKAAQALIFRAERAEALLRECLARLSTYHPADQRLADRITAHLSENSRG